MVSDEVEKETSWKKKRLGRNKGGESKLNEHRDPSECRDRSKLRGHSQSILINVACNLWPVPSHSFLAVKSLEKQY